VNNSKHNNGETTHEQLLQELAALRKRVAELEKTRAEFERLREKHKTSLESITDGFVSFDRGWHYTYANDAALRVLQKSREELLGRTPWEAFPESPHLKFYTEFTRSCDQNIPVHFEEFYPEPLNCWFECHCYPGPDGLSVYFQDVTERKQAEEALRRSEELERQRAEELKTVLDAVPACVWISHDPDSSHITGSRVADELLRLPYGAESSLTAPESVRPQHFKIVKGGRELTNDELPVQRAARGTEVRNFEYSIVFNDGTTRYMVGNASPLYDGQGEPRGSVAAFVDITERKRAEAALKRARLDLEFRVQERTAELRKAYEKLETEMAERAKVEEQLRQAHKMEAIGTLAGGIAHDFNNMLAAIIGFSEMVEEDIPEGSPIQSYIQRILSASFRGRDLVKQILTFSRKAELPRQPVSVLPIIQETIQLLRASLPTTIEIRLITKATTDTIQASPAEVQQVLMNLATNAAMAMREHGGILHISLGDIDVEPDSPVVDPDVEPGEYLQIVVEDSGSGMSPDVMKRVFEPFFTTRLVGEGTGMGLAVVYGIVKSLQGTITVESEPGVGSTFRVFLPKVRTETAFELTQPDQSPRGTERILFVDDEELLMEWGQAALERLGYTVTALPDSTEALKLFSSDPSQFDLVMTDQTMPKLTGLHLARKLLEIRSNIPIILCTGHSDTVSQETAKEAGIKEFLMKPLVKQELAQVIRRVLDAKA